jgi:hypothetical protein
VTLQFPFNRSCSCTYFSVAVLKILLFASVNNYFIERGGKWQFKYKFAWSSPANIYCSVPGGLDMLNGGLEKRTFV